jgi:hypothetical protein
MNKFINSSKFGDELLFISNLVFERRSLEVSKIPSEASSSALGAFRPAAADAGSPPQGRG